MLETAKQDPPFLLSEVNPCHALCEILLLDVHTLHMTCQLTIVTEASTLGLGLCPCASVSSVACKWLAQCA